VLSAGQLAMSFHGCSSSRLSLSPAKVQARYGMAGGLLRGL